jgi:signal transduction histidine kinase
MRKILGEVPPPGKLPYTYLNHESRALLEEQFESRREGKSDTYWVTLKIAGGEERSALVCGSPIIDSEKGFLGSIGVFIDMTEILAQRESLTEEDRLNTIGAVVDRLDHKLNNALMVIRGQAEVFLRREPEGPNSQGLSRIIEQVDVINNELKALGELKKIETEPYYGDHLMLSIPEKEEEPPEIS